MKKGTLAIKYTYSGFLSCLYYDHRAIWGNALLTYGVKDCNVQYCQLLISVLPAPLGKCIDNSLFVLGSNWKVKLAWCRIIDPNWSFQAKPDVALPLQLVSWEPGQLMGQLQWCR